MALLNRELSFMIMLATSLAVGAIVRLLGKFRYKKEVLSAVGIIQIMWFCEIDALHIFTMMIVGTTIIQLKFLGPRTVFVYCFLHRLFFSSSKFFGLPRDESNLANATMFISTLKMVTVAYEVDDYRKKQKGKENGIPHKTKWINLSKEPSAYDVLCYMTCFAAAFTGPIFRYKTYYDMLNTYINVPVKRELTTKFLVCGISYVLFLIWPYNTAMFYQGTFYEYNVFARIFVMTFIVLKQSAKYIVAWLLAENVCVLIGLGGYPVSSNSIAGMGPSNEPTEEKVENFNFETISTMKVEAVWVPTVRETLQTWNNCTQWWLAYFVYTSTILPRNRRLLRALNVMLVSAAWHGIKPGYFMSFPMLSVLLLSEEIFLNATERRLSWKPAIFLCKLLHWLFYKMFLISFLFSVFVLQEYDNIIPFVRSTYFYGYVFPIICLLVGALINYLFPTNKTKKSE